MYCCYQICWSDMCRDPVLCRDCLRSKYQSRGFTHWADPIIDLPRLCVVYMRPGYSVYVCVCVCVCVCMIVLVWVCVWVAVYAFLVLISIVINSEKFPTRLKYPVNFYQSLRALERKKGLGLFNLFKKKKIFSKIRVRLRN